MPTTYWPAARTALPPAFPGEVIPRRDHAVRLFWIAVAGMLPIIPTAPPTSRDMLAASLLAFWVTGAAVGAAQVRWCWRGRVPYAPWVTYAALGWATGAVAGLLVAGAAFQLLGSIGVELRYGAYRQMVHVLAGAGAGWNAASLQAMVLRRRGQPWRWWVYASAGAAALAALFPLLVFAGCGWN